MQNRTLKRNGGDYQRLVLLSLNKSVVYWHHVGTYALIAREEEVHMRGPTPPALTLTDAERRALAHFVRGHRTPQHLALRARLVLAAADGTHNRPIARPEGATVADVRRCRARWRGREAVPVAAD